MADKCAAKTSGGCCCDCRWHKPAAKSWGLLSETDGWVCWAPEFDVACIEHPKHSFCECWAAKSQGARDLMDLYLGLYDFEKDGVSPEDERRLAQAVEEARAAGVLLED